MIYENNKPEKSADRVERLKLVIYAMIAVNELIKLAPFRFDGELLESHLRGYRRKMVNLRVRYRNILKGKG